MSDSTGIRRKSRLAVFEHVTEKKKNVKKLPFKTNRLQSDDDDSSPSESELVIEEDPEKPKKSKRPPLIKYTEESLNLFCNWAACTLSYKTWSEYNAHIMEHASFEKESLRCQWKDCETVLTSVPLLLQHISYHGYLSKLRNMGENVLKRNKLPDCVHKRTNNVIPLQEKGYTCQWEYCLSNFDNIYDFFLHMKLHIKNNPRIAREALNEIIVCCWKNCNLRFSCQYKLDEHLRVHTKEKTIACPDCYTVFGNRTKFMDHRNRQLLKELRRYQCSQCLKLFPGVRLLRDHMRSHINHYKCSMCDMTCLLPSTLAQHVRYKHVNEKLFKCRECEKTFVTIDSLNLHKKTHIKTNQMNCNLCDFSCRTKVGLDNHRIREHDQQKSIYECHCCKKQLKRGSYLTRHLMNKHNYHWPSGHSRFRYRKDNDGIYRLQTVRYESLEVTKEMIRSESMQTSSTKHCDNTLSSPPKSSPVKEDGRILITINDLDEQGNIIKSQVVESTAILNPTNKVVDSPEIESSTDESSQDIDNTLAIAKYKEDNSHEEVEFEMDITDTEITDSKNVNLEEEKPVAEDEKPFGKEEKVLAEESILKFKFFKEGAN